MPSLAFLNSLSRNWREIGTTRCEACDGTGTWFNDGYPEEPDTEHECDLCDGRGTTPSDRVDVPDLMGEQTYLFWHPEMRCKCGHALGDHDPVKDFGECYRGYSPFKGRRCGCNLGDVIGPR